MSDENVVTMKVPDNFSPTLSHGGRQFAVSKEGTIRCKPSDVTELSAHGLVQIDGPDGKPSGPKVDNFATKAAAAAAAAAEKAKK